MNLEYLDKGGFDVDVDENGPFIVESNSTHLIPLESVGMFVDPTNAVTYPMLADGINADLYDGMACPIGDLEEEWFDDLDESDSTIVKYIMDNLDLTPYGVEIAPNEVYEPEHLGDR